MVWPDLLEHLHSKLVVKGKEVFDLSGENRMTLRDRFGKPGDVLWVRETWAVAGARIRYKADANWTDEEKDLGETAQWKPSIHMPKSACRIFLQVKSVRVERLQDISEKDILSEGVRVPVSNKSTENNRVVFELGVKNKAIDFLPKGTMSGIVKPTSKDFLFAFWAELWCNINGRESWEENPWVWVVEFERIEKPENFK